MNRTLSIILVVAGAWVSPTHAGSIPEANLTVRVVAEDGAPVASADVKLGFEGAEYGHNELKLGKTDHNGDFSALGRTLGIVFYSVHKDGYYDNLDSRYEFFKQEVNHWVPENPTCLVVLKRIIEPTPMYVRQVQLTFPVLNQAVGIDLDVGDWVAPHGKGRVADLFIRATCRFVDLNDFNSELSISFPKRLDGILAFRSRSTERKRAQLAPASSGLGILCRSIPKNIA